MFKRRELNKKLAYVISCFVTSLRRGEGFMMDTEVLWHNIGKVREGTLDNVVIPMVGRFKGGGGGRRHHLQAIFNETDKKLKVKWRLYRFNYELIRQKHGNDPT